MSARAASRVRHRRLGSLSLIAALSLGSCGKTEASRGGLMLIISSEGDLPIGRFDVEVKSKGKTQLSNEYKVPQEATLPTSIALVSNGDPQAQAQIAITAWQLVPGGADVPLDRRDAIVTQVPADRVATLRVVLSASCSSKVKVVDSVAQSTCSDGQTCDGAGDCVSSTVVATSLPTYHAGDENSSTLGGDAGANGDANGGSAGTIGSPSMSGAGGSAGSAASAVCGNGTLEAGEQCDDANTAANDGCNAACKVETGYVCSGAPSTCAKTCNDGKIDANETCDDGNAIAGDGCQACAIESGFTCDNSALPSKCTDINECATGTPCDANATCANTVGSYTCTCKTGFTGTGKVCDVDECANMPCDVNASCKNTPGSYTCTCIGGYTGNGKVCNDVCGNPCMRGTITEFAVPTASANVQYIAAGPDGNLWFTESGAGKVGRVTPTGVFTEFAFPSSDGASGITAGADGNMWLSQFARVTRVTMAGEITVFPSSGFYPAQLAPGPDGNVWATNSSNNPPKIAKITSAGVITPFTLVSTATFPLGIVTGPDNNLWFTEAGGGNIGVLSTGGVLLHEYPIPTPKAFAASITLGSDGNLWFAESGDLPTNGNKIGRMTPTGTLTEFPVPTANASPSWITAHSDGTLWFTEGFANKIGRITTNGKIIEFAIPTADSSPIAIASGSDGNLWFTEARGNKIGRIVP